MQFYGIDEEMLCKCVALMPAVAVRGFMYTQVCELPHTCTPFCTYTQLMCEFTGALCEHEFSLFLDSQVATHILTLPCLIDECLISPPRDSNFGEYTFYLGQNEIKNGASSLIHRFPQKLILFM